MSVLPRSPGDSAAWHLPHGNPDPAIWPTGRLLSMAARLVEHAWNQTLAEAGLTHAGLLVLLRLDRGAASQREIARTQGVQEQTIARTLAHLERADLIDRQIDPRDRRRRIVQISEAGRIILKELSGNGEALTEQILNEQGRDVGELRGSLAGLVVGLSERRWPGPDQGG